MRLQRLRHKLKSIRHFRGHGIHSPYVYAIVREVIMRGGSLEEQVERLIAHCGYTNVSREEITEGSEVVILEQTSPSVELYTCARERGTTVVILHPNSDNERRSMCQKIMRGHRSTTIERFDYIVIFNNHLPKQHFKL